MPRPHHVLPLLTLALACDSAGARPLGGGSADGGGALETGAPDAAPSPDLGAPPDLGAVDGGTTDSGVDPACATRAEPGPCGAAFMRFSFDPALGRCVPFTWGGCGDNPNNYETMTACALRCEPGATACGGFAGATCRSDQYCDFEDDGCGAADGQGVCRLRPTGCPDIYDPVCGCDGVEHGNACDAAAAGTDVAQRGGC